MLFTTGTYGILLEKNCISLALSRLCIPRGPVQLQLLKDSHDCLFSGHPGRDRTFSNLSQHFFWLRMSTDVKNFVRSCEFCQRNKSGRIKAGLLQPLPVPESPWSVISMDLIMGLPKTGCGYDAIYTFVDKLTKYVHLIPTVSTVTAEGVAQLYVNHVFSMHGLSQSIISDRDPRFNAAFFQELMSLLGSHLKMSTANHPEADGQTERMNRIVEDTLRTFVNHRHWDQLLPLCQFAINNAVQSSTGESPFFLNHWYNPLVPSAIVDTRTSFGLSAAEKEPQQWLRTRTEAIAQAKDALEAARARQTLYSDRGRKNVSFRIGEKVLVHRDFVVTPEGRNRPCNKLRPRWYGPFEILERIGANAYRLQLPHTLRCHPVFNVSGLKKY